MGFSPTVRSKRRVQKLDDLSGHALIVRKSHVDWGRVNWVCGKFFFSSVLSWHQAEPGDSSRNTEQQTLHSTDMVFVICHIARNLEEEKSPKSWCPPNERTAPDGARKGALGLQLLASF